jgi:hypothetical protein
MPRLCLIVCTLSLALLAALAGGSAAPAQLAAAQPAGHGCLASGNGYLRARIRGAVNLDVDWHNGEIECAGGPRADGSGLRVSFAGPRHADGRRLRLVFGMGTAREGRAGRELPTNLTVILEGEQRLLAGAVRRSWRVVARGFCVGPASTLSSDARILVSRFDFAGTAVFGDEPPEQPLLAAPRP